LREKGTKKRGESRVTGLGMLRRIFFEKVREHVCPDLGVRLPAGNAGDARNQKERRARSKKGVGVGEEGGGISMKG